MSRRLACLVIATALVQAALMGLAASSLFFYPVVGSSQRLFGASIGFEAVFYDVRTYGEYARYTLNGLVPYQNFPVEYPIGALPLFILPAEFTLGEPEYRVGFGAEMMLFQALTLGLLAAWVGRREGE